MDFVPNRRAGVCHHRSAREGLQLLRPFLQVQLPLLVSFRCVNQDQIKFLSPGLKSFSLLLTCSLRWYFQVFLNIYKSRRPTKLSGQRRYCIKCSVFNIQIEMIKREPVLSSPILFSYCNEVLDLLGATSGEEWASPDFCSTTTLWDKPGDIAAAITGETAPGPGWNFSVSVPRWSSFLIPHRRCSNEMYKTP